ncbi:translocon-associated protein subunit beta isoform X2 [Hemicordylus capensis]|uniref:translocon-associated protein subunit beta isoform X2 n=1 Tax=Hemicordylus capensis TaxID=884348 RepID=UPI00230312CF|nr:translocon-associated protein subunit beta isoform X2 [Hemicordylus capensis]
MKLWVFLVLALVSSVYGEEGARLLASKSLLNRYAVEGRDLTLQYNIYNVGSSAALEVELSDDSFPPEDFGIVSGMLNVKWDRIAPASNVSHTVVLRPLKAGYFNFTSATITYLAQEGGLVVVGFTSAPGQGGILAQREFDRRFSPHFAQQGGDSPEPVKAFRDTSRPFPSWAPEGATLVRGKGASLLGRGPLHQVVTARRVRRREGPTHDCAEGSD